jgi:hypothetical protein
VAGPGRGGMQSMGNLNFLRSERLGPGDLAGRTCLCVTGHLWESFH